MAGVHLRNLVKEYPVKKGNPPFKAVKSINLEISDGEFMVLVGPSGCGKSTTLRMIAGLESITEGEIWIGERCVNSIPPKKRDISMVFQSYALYPHKTVFENMAFGLEMMHVAKAEVQQRVDAASAMLGLGGLLDRKPSALSGGQRQRVALGRAIVRKPKVFLFDEPLSNLDAKMRVSTRLEISNLHKRLGTTMIYVTHDQVEAMTMGDRICVMNDGCIMQVDEPLTLYNEPSNLFVASFIGSPAMNFFKGRIESDRDSLCFVESNASEGKLVLPLTPQKANRMEAHAGESVIVGIRPESIINPNSVLPDSTTIQIECVLRNAEPMGAETYLNLDTGANCLTARVDSGYRFPLGSKVPLSILANQIHFFDPATECVIGSGA